MSKRFIDTSFYKSPFVRGLKGPLKSLYSFIICDCDGAGIWAADLQIAGILIGFEISQKEFDENFIVTGKAVDLKNGKYFFADFIQHQYPKGLCETNPAQKNFIVELRKYSLIDGDLKVLQRPFEGSKVKVKVKVKVKEEVKKAKISNLILPFNSPEFSSVWHNLIQTKKWVKKSELALQASLKKLSKVSELDAIQMIENSIAGEWQGLFDLKPHEKNGNTNNRSQSDSAQRKSDVAAMVDAARKHLFSIDNANNGAGNTG